MFRPTQAIVDLKRIQANVRTLKTMVSAGFFCPMVKANAYGHGAVAVAQALVSESVRHLGVVLVEEGLELREAGIETEILVFSRLTEESAKAVVENRLTPVLSTFEDLKMLAARSRTQAIVFHAKVDTGMHRMGFALEDMLKLKAFLADERRVRCVGLCTHLSHGTDAAQPNGVTKRQIQNFRRADRELGEPQLVHHVLNSDAMLAGASAGIDCAWLGARPGLAIYGLCGGLKPAMSLVTRLDLVRKVARGESVSYGGRWTASKDSWIGVVPIGYGDGYWRLFGNRAQMLFRGRRVPVVGTVCMDYSLLDLTAACSDVGEPKIDEDVVVFGEQAGAAITVEELTELAGTIPYELVTGLSNRVPRVYK